MGGMQHLWDNPEAAGTLGLRFLQNVNENDEKIKETCGAGFFRNWADLEVWSSTHPSHLAIFVGALAHGEWPLTLPDHSFDMLTSFLSSEVWS